MNKLILTIQTCHGGLLFKKEKHIHAIAMYARELTSGSGAKCVPAGVPEQQPDPTGGGAGARGVGVVVLHRHLNADADRRRHAQDDADAHLLRRSQLQAGMAPDQRGENKTREEEGEGEARRGRRVRRHQHRPHKRATAA
jgi:hypothetical protein